MIRVGGNRVNNISFGDRIKPTYISINSYVEDLLRQNYQIPTFQREVVWEGENVKKLWDSIYKFYPLGSLLIWKTDVKLQKHREIGGHVIDGDNFERPEYQYILDGQQRTTSLLTSIEGGAIEGKENFDPTLYFDLTIEDTDEPDDESYKKRFLFWNEIDDDNGRKQANIEKKQKYEQGLIVRLKDIQKSSGMIEDVLDNYLQRDYRSSHPIVRQLRRIKNVLENYNISMIELKGIQVSEVCEIFERINQEGKPLSIFDIVVAKTYRPEGGGETEFYLRELINEFKFSSHSEYMKLDDLTFLQMLAILINKDIENSGVQNITDKYLNNIRAEHIEYVWEDGQKAMRKTFDFFENHLRIKGPQLIPFRYFYMTIAYYFYKNENPDYEFINKYFWYHSFHREDLLRNTTHLLRHIDFLKLNKEGRNPEFDRFMIDKNDLRQASYNSRNRLSRAILSLYASNDPRDWANPNRSVLSDVYYTLTDQPNLHHVFPIDYIKQLSNDEQNMNKYSVDSLMNIAYLTQITNLKISNKNPVDYIKAYDKNNFDEVLNNHLISHSILGWARANEMPSCALDSFIEERIENVIEDLEKKLSGVRFEIVDTASGNSEHTIKLDEEELIVTRIDNQEFTLEQAANTINITTNSEIISTDKEALAYVYEVCKKINEGKLGWTEGKNKIALRINIKPASAGDYIQAFRAMMKGEKYTRTIKEDATRLFIENIRNDYGEVVFKKALAACGAHARYYENLGYGKLQYVEKIIAEYSN